MTTGEPAATPVTTPSGADAARLRSASNEESDLVLVVRSVAEAAEGVRVITLGDPAGGTLPRWAAGAHVDVTAGEHVRQYSLCGDPDDQHTWTIAVLLEQQGRGGSEWLHGSLAVGDHLRVRGPRNHFVLGRAERYLFLAGGIGITPLLPMILRAQAEGADWHLHYGGRTRGSMGFAADLVARHGDRVTVWPQDECGLLDLPSILGGLEEDTQVYCCGPEPLIRAVEDATADRPDSVHVERFVPREQGSPVRAGSFQVELAVSGVTLTVPPERSILSVLTEAGVNVLSSCAEGTCGTCETEVVEGEVDHRDSLLTEAERATGSTMFVCCSRARSDRLVLRL